MATGDLITASRYNQIQANVSSVLGVGAGNSGYGQQLQSSQVASTQTITAEHMNRLRQDMLTIFVHQRGDNNGFANTIPIIESGTDLVSDAPSGVGKNEYESYPQLANTLLADRNTYTAQAISTNFSVESNRITSTRNTPWGGSQQSQSVFHEVRVQFATANARRHFFNTGSQIRFEASLTNFPGGAGQDKFNNWAGMFTGMGTIIFKSSETINTGSGTGTEIGNFNLTDDYQIVFTKQGSLLYSDNTYKIKARQMDSQTIEFLVEFNDLHTGSSTVIPAIYGVDEPVEGTLTSRIHQFRATGTGIGNISKVIAPIPTYQNTQNV
jgi:hypothetical protein